jgi:O-6-methylguanine DNA methyltransferase
MTSQLVLVPLATPDGLFHAGYSQTGLARLEFPETTEVPPAAKVPREVTAWHRLTTAAVRAVLAGKPTGDLPPLDLQGTDFQRAVWAALRDIPRGRTVAYGELARTVGRPRAVRAVGAACGANPIPVLIPCHRVLAAGGGLGGFTAGLEWKRRLLAREGVKS